MIPALGGPLALVGLIGSALAPSRTRTEAPSATDESFAGLLNKAQSGTISSGLMVTPAKHSGLELSPEQLGRLSAAADQAEADGAHRALVIMDDKAYVVDIASREVERAVPLSEAGVIGGIDTVVTAPGASSGPETPTGPGGVGDNASLLRILADD